MSRIQTSIDAISSVALKIGVGRLAREAGVNVDTASRLLKKPPKQIQNLIKLETAAAKHRAEEPTT